MLSLGIRILSTVLVVGLIIGLVVAIVSYNAVRYSYDQLNQELEAIRTQTVAVQDQPETTNQVPATQPTTAPQYTQPTQAPQLAAQPDMAAQAASGAATGITAQGQAQQNADGTVSVFVLNPEGGDQIQNRHPSIYSQTQVSGNPIRYVIDVPSGYFAIVGGFNVDGISNGVYQGLGPGHYTRTVTDGFVEIVRSTWARAEWDFRLGEAQQFNWARQNINSGPIQ